MIDALVARARAAAVGAEAELEQLDETAGALRALSIVRAAGLTALCVPERDGGASTKGSCTPDLISVRVLCALRRELAYHHGLLDLMFIEQGLGAFPIVLGGNAALRAEVLPKVARGEMVSAFALTEIGAGSSLSEVATRATRVGGAWELEGTKTFISNAGIADFYTVLARVDGADDTLAMFYVPARSPGLSVQRFEVMAPHPIGDLRFERVAVRAEHLLGVPGQGLELALGTLTRFRTSVAAAANGFARRALDESVRHLRTRHQFGKPLAAFQALRFDVAEMDVRLRAAELLVAEAAERVDNGLAATAEVARAKLFATEGAAFLCDRAVQHLGGLGVKRGSTVERLYREVRALRIYEGTSEIQKLVLAKEIFDGAASTP